MSRTHLFQKRNQFGCEDVSAQGVGGEVFLQPLVGDFSLVDHAPCVVDEDVQLVVLWAELIRELDYH